MTVCSLRSFGSVCVRTSLWYNTPPLSLFVILPCGRHRPARASGVKFSSASMHHCMHVRPQVFAGRRVLGLNEQLKFLRYHEGQYFAPHFDGAFARCACSPGKGGGRLVRPQGICSHGTD